MKKVNVRLIKYIFIWLLIGFGVPYLVHIQWDFFGATYITFKDILGIWLLCPSISFMVLGGMFLNSK